MSNFRSYRAYKEFERRVKNDDRYVRTEQDESFLNTVIVTAEERKHSLPQNTFLHRAQLGHSNRSLDEEEENEEIPCPYSPDRMTPRENRATAGRANPKGISYLYLASTKETAMSEVRPGVGGLISVAQFRTDRPLDLVDCALDQRPDKVYMEEPGPEEREKEVWADINRAFSDPVSRDDDLADYAPTQIISESFKKYGYDGVLYQSTLGDGYNVVLFDTQDATLVNCRLFEARSVDFQFKQVSQSYFVHEELEE